MARSASTRGIMARLVRPTRTHLVAALAIAILSASATDDATAQSPPSWRTLTFRTKKLVFKAKAQVHLSTAVAADLQLHPEATVVVPESLLRLEIRSRLFGRQSTHRLWLDRIDGRALKRQVVEVGGRQRLKVYTYAAGGVSALRRTPANGQEKKSDDPESWSEESIDFYATDEGISAPLTEPPAILYLVSAFDPSRFDQGLEISTFTDQQQLRTVIRRVRDESVRTRYRVGGDTDRASARPVEAVIYSISSHAADGDEPDFRLLGLEGDIEIAVEKQRLIPIEIRGRIPPLGKVTVKLLEAELATD